MNNISRKRIDRTMSYIEKSENLRNEINAAIEELRDEEQEKFDNLSEGLQGSDRGQSIEAAVNALDEAMIACDKASELEEISFDFDSDDIITALDEAKAC